MRKYLLRRIGQIVLTLIIFQVVMFLILYSMPGDITNRLLTNPDVPPEVRDQWRRALGLDRPWYEQLWSWQKSFFTGDLGVSFSEYPRPVVDILQERLPRTLVLFAAATVVQFVVGYHAGRVLAWQRGGAVEYGATVVGVTLWTAFTPWFALMMIFIFSVQLGWLPLGSFLTPRVWTTVEIPGLDPSSNSKANFIFNRMIWSLVIALGLWLTSFILTQRLGALQRSRLRWAASLVVLAGLIGYWTVVSDFGYLAWDITYHLMLPVLTLTLLGFAGTMLLMRTTMLETLREDYVQTARAKGLPEHVIRDKHAARNALLPVFTGLIIGLPFLISGGVLTETVFSWPGMGLTLYSAALAEDIPLIMGSFSFIGVLTLVAHLVADVAYAFLDPRIRYS